jgi:hypothetical protein
MPVTARGIVCDTEQRMLDYYFTYLDLFRSLQQRGYAYRGEDEICFGVTAEGGIVHMRHGTHRLASALLKRCSSPGWSTCRSRLGGAGGAAQRGGPLAAMRYRCARSRPQLKADGGRSDGGAMRRSEIFGCFLYRLKRQCWSCSRCCWAWRRNLSIAGPCRSWASRR